MAETSSSSSADSAIVVDKKADVDCVVDESAMIPADVCKRKTDVEGDLAALPGLASDADIQRMEEGEHHDGGSNVDGDEGGGESICRIISLILAFLLGLLTVPLSIIIIVSLWIFPCLPDEWRENSFTFAATIGSVCGFFLIGILLIVVQGISAFS